MDPAWFVALWLCIALPDGAQDCALQIAPGRWPSELDCRQAVEFVVPEYLDTLERRGWQPDEVRRIRCLGPTRAS